MQFCKRVHDSLSCTRVYTRIPNTSPNPNPDSYNRISPRTVLLEIKTFEKLGKTGQKLAYRMHALTAAMMLLFACKLGELWSRNSGDYEGKNWDFCNNWAKKWTKIGIFHRISQQVLDWCLSHFQRWSMCIWRLLPWLKFCRRPKDFAIW